MMGNLKILLCVALFSTLITGCNLSNTKMTKDSDDQVIFAVNAGGMGYFANEQGSLLFGKQYEYVNPFS